MGSMVIACFKPKPGEETRLLQLLAGHVPRLRALGLASDRPATVMKAADGTYVEVFEWQSEDAVARAHEHPEVQAMWAQFQNACDYVPIGEVAGAGELFTSFTPVVLPPAHRTV